MMMNWFFNSRYATLLYEVVVHGRNPFVKCVGLIGICIILILRTLPLYLRRAKTAVALAAYAALAYAMGFALATCVVAASCLVLLIPSLRENLVYNDGHRGGAEGFDGGYEKYEFDPQLLVKMGLPQGDYCENTVQAVRNLIRKDKAHGPIKNLQYIEFDVQETKDGELVVFHDKGIARAFTMSGVNVMKLKRMGMDVIDTQLKDLTYEQLQELDVGGRAGVKVPTLEAFLGCIREEGACCSVAVEVKHLHTDEARQKLIRLCREYKDAVTPMLDKTCRSRMHAGLGWIFVISFPHSWAMSFGEFGSAAWLRWARAFKTAGVPVRCCMFHFIDFLAGV